MARIGVRYVITVLTLATMLAISTGALADSVDPWLSSTDQFALVTQLGFENRGWIIQTDPFNGGGNRAQIGQMGAENLGFLWQAGAEQRAFILQIGDGNQLFSAQNGSESFATISQLGDRNFALTWQEGSENGIVIMQFGDESAVRVLQGGEMKFRIIQFGR